MDTKFTHPKPLWLEIFTKGRWVAIAPRIYCPVPNPQDFPALVAHEKKHIEQQTKTGKYKWLLKYFTSKKFRLTEEAQAVAAEIAETPANLRPWLAEVYARQLAGPEYFHCAPSHDAALQAIHDAAQAAGVAL